MSEATNLYRDGGIAQQINPINFLDYIHQLMVFHHPDDEFLKADVDAAVFFVEPDTDDTQTILCIDSYLEYAPGELGLKEGDIQTVGQKDGKSIILFCTTKTQTPADAEQTAAKLVKYLNEHNIGRVGICIQTCSDADDETHSQVFKRFIYGLQMGNYNFSMKSEAEKPSLTHVYVDLSTAMAGSLAPLSIEDAINEASLTALGSKYMRFLIDLPPNVLTTGSLLDAAMGLKADGLSTDYRPVTKNDNLRAMYAVGKGSNQPSCLIRLRYKGDPNAPLTALVGKGLVFDTGGINLKRDGGTGMKADMGGGALVLGTILAAALQKAPVNLIGVIGAVCNDIGRDSYRPDDVLTAYNGKTIEVINTDAEGRLVLADCLSYVEEIYKPAQIFSFATLTGAAVMATGSRAPIFSDDEAFANNVTQAALSAGEKVLHFPMDDDLKPLMDSKIADVRNLATKPQCGHTTAAIFLNHFVESTPYCHVDIAGACKQGYFGVPMMLKYLNTLATTQAENKRRSDAALDGAFEGLT